MIEAAAWIDLDAVTKRRRIVYSRCALSLITVFPIAAVVAAAAAVRRIDIGTDTDTTANGRYIVYSRCALPLIAVFAIAAVVAASAAVR